MLGKHLVSSVLTQIPVFILGIVTGIFSTRILGDDTRGAFSLFQANTQLFVLIFSLGIQTGIVYFISSKKISESLVAGMSIFIFVISSCLLLGLLLLSNLFGFTQYFMADGYVSNLYLGVLFLMYATTFFSTIISAFFQAHSKFATINRIAIINSIINASVFVLLFLLLNASSLSPATKFNYVLFSSLGVLIINNLLWFYFQLKEIRIKPGFGFELKSHLKPFVLYNLLIYTGMFINFFNYRLDLWIVNHYLDEKDLSYYSLAAGINQIIIYISVTIATVMLPNLSGKTREERIRTFIRINRISFAFFAGLVSCAFIVSAVIIPLMYGKDFEAAVFPFRVLLPGVLFSCITQLFSTFIVSNNKNVYNIIACAAGLIFTVVLDLLLIPEMGIKGASIATTISYFVIFLVTYIFVVRQTNKITYNFFVPEKGDLRSIYQQIKRKR